MSSSTRVLSHSPSPCVGIVGGGQLGKMMGEAASRLGVDIHVLDPSPQAPAAKLAKKFVQGALDDLEKIKEMAEGCDVVTVEIEHVGTTALESLMTEKNIPVHPSPGTIRLIQDKLQQKIHLNARGIPVAPFLDTPTLADAYEAGKKFGYPYLLKSRFSAYDGRGNYVVKTEGDVETAWKHLNEKDLYVEKFVPFKKELAVMIARQAVPGTASQLSGEVSVFPIVETIQRDNICHTVIAPANISGRAFSMATKLAKDAFNELDGAGIYGMEMFLYENEAGEEDVIINEIAPRPHNSGHYTQNGCVTDQ
eukprot:GFYU01003639.1.p1 GENE.GFYU01003639.1~~GFYU01003639.1.p1  ORF type:complete len:348 (-),score=93.35 GFYU01003639.1:1882-2805(-)